MNLSPVKPAMDDRSKAPTTICSACGASSSDPDWCDSCGAKIAKRGVDSPLWLMIGDKISFKISIANPELESESVDISGSWEGPKTQIDIPVWGNKRPSTGGDRGRVEPKTQPVRPAEMGKLAAQAVEAEDVFETIGVDEALEGHEEEDLSDEFSSMVPGVDTPVADLVSVESALSNLEFDVELEDQEQELQVQIIGQRETYSQRRLWDALDVEQEHRYVIEERLLLPGEELEEAIKLDPVDPFSKRFIYTPMARRAYEERVVTLYEAPRGQSLESWRRAVGREAATPRAILSVLRPLINAVQECHEQSRVHLHLNPRTIWVHKGEVGFTGVDRLETVPIERSRFRATVGFSAPEVFGRSKQHIDLAADVYSLGAIAYYLIAGVIPPVAPETAFAPALAPRDYRPTFPIGWAEAVLKATDPVPDRRYKRPAEFLAAIELGFRQMKARHAREASVTLLLEGEKHIGFNKKKRSPINQDHVFTAVTRDRNLAMIAVADGVSTATYGSGDLASGFLAKRAMEAWEKIRVAESFSPEKIVNEIIQRANDDIIDYVNREFGVLTAGPSQVMGSTALIGIVLDGVLTLASVGDSRCYVIRNDLMECLTRDHNLFTLSLIEGLGIDDVLTMPHGDALARCLGTFEVSEDGFLSAIDPQPDIYRLRLLPGDNILLCSDGLFDYAGSTYEESESNIRQRVLSESHPGISCLELILLANRGGGGDNIGVALLKVLGDA